MIADPHITAYKVFRAAAALPPDAREAAIRGSGADEDVICLALEILAQFEGGDTGSGRSSTDRTNTVLGDLHIGGMISWGGSGTVYRAWRETSGPKTPLAVKFLDMVHREAPRFLRERQILVNLDHEGICKFLDAGVAGSTPYLVMECVEGQSVTDYCNERRLTITKRLRLFVRICRAVEYAHQHGVLHRDLNPSNILVTHQGEVKILDFGVAALVAPDAESAERLTRPGTTPWTKAWASPEQVRGEVCSYAADVYALGVLLYQLTTSRMPFSEEDLRRPDWRMIVETQVPTLPSEALAASVEAHSYLIPATFPGLPLAASHRGRVLRGNLDEVILKALAKSLDRRYQRVDELRMDIECFLEGLPVSARTSSAWERLMTWGNRHPGLTAVFVLCAVALFLLSLVATSWESEWERSWRDRQNAARRLAVLTSTGLPAIAAAVSDDVELLGEVTRIETDHIQRIRDLDDAQRAGVAPAWISAATLCARQWMRLGKPDRAVAVLELVQEQTEWLYSVAPGAYRVLYADLLRERIHALRRLKRDADADKEQLRLNRVERSVRWGLQL